MCIYIKKRFLLVVLTIHALVILAIGLGAQLMDSLIFQLEKDKVAMAAPQRARLAVEKLPTDLLISRPFARRR